MIKIVNKQDCCGCSACQQSCPKKCISMQSDKEGFLYPVVDENACVNCGLCEKVCPILNADEKTDEVLNSYIGYIKDTDRRLASSSGGMFSELALKILKEGGVVFGAAFDKDFQVHHIAVRSVDDLYLLQGSKYVQSRTEDSFKDVKEILMGGGIVLYSGTPCQIFGLKAYLKKEYDRLYTVDVLCHGVPSPLVWQKYMEWQQGLNGSAIRRTFFRQKHFGWKTYALELVFDNSKAYERWFNDDPYGEMFINNILHRPSCYECKFKKLERVSDITIGDCWGVEKHSPEMDDDKGTSVIYIHTEKGKKLFDDISDNLNLKEVDEDMAVSPTSQSRRSITIHPSRDKFFADLAAGASFKKLYSYVKPTFLRRVKRKLKRVYKKIFSR